MNLNINDRNALVCGSTQGIGRATAIMLAEEGVKVTLVARNEEKLKQVLAELPQQRKHSYIVADFSNPEDLDKKIKQFISENHGFHIVINNTGGPKGGNILDATLEEFENAYTMHLKCNHILAQSTIPFMKEEGFGRIVNIISTSVKEPIPGLGVSNTTRGAVGNWSKTLSLEVAPFGITVNNVLPGFTETERLYSLINTNATKENITADNMAEIMKSSTPAKRFAKAEEVANAIVFLASDKAAYINGINIPVDGGRTKSL